MGFFCGYYLGYAILGLLGRGHSHDDMYTLVDAGVLGMLAGALLFPAIAWASTRRRTK